MFMNYLAILGRQPNISLAELEALFSDVRQISPMLATFTANSTPHIDRLGGSIKLAVRLEQKPLDYLTDIPKGKITIGISDYSIRTTQKSTISEAIKLKKILTRHGRSVRIVEGKSPALSTATSLHNGLSGKNIRKIEFIKVDTNWYRVIGIQDIDAYSRRDQARPARDAKVGMLPPKLAQILINLCGPLPKGSRILDPFCGTGVVLQEALLMGYHAYGTDLSERMIEYTEKNLKWLRTAKITETCNFRDTEISVGDATTFQWTQPINAVACESYLGQPMSQIPTSIKLKEQKQACSAIILGFLKNLAPQIQPNTPVTIAIPAWLREDSTYERLEILAFLEDLGYNVNNKSREGLIYCREKQIVARDILILRKK